MGYAWEMHRLLGKGTNDTGTIRERYGNDLMLSRVQEHICFCALLYDCDSVCDMHLRLSWQYD
jgi:hypothetical protein